MLLYAVQEVCCALCDIGTRLLPVLAGVEDPGMQPALTTIAVQLADALQKGISDGTFFTSSDSHAAEYSTRPWPSQKRKSVSSTSWQGYTQPAWWRDRRGGWVAIVEAATNRDLVAEIVRLFCTLTAQANQAGASTTGAAMQWWSSMFLCCVGQHAPCVMICMC